MKHLTAIILLSLPILTFGQKKDTVKRFIDTCRMEQYDHLTDTPKHDKKGDFTVVCHSGKCDTIRNGVYEYYQIKKRLKNKKQ